MAERSARVAKLAMAADRAGSSGAATPPVVVKKYANRRLYNTEASSYVTLEDLAGMVRQGRDFVVYDAKSGEDITRSVLTQIIVEEESKGRSLLPESFLRQIIGFYGDSLQSLVPRYLEAAMAGFARQQEQMRRSMEQAMGGLMPFPPTSFGGLEEVSKQNLAMLERAMSLFSPFRGPEGFGQGAGQGGAGQGGAGQGGAGQGGAGQGGAGQGGAGEGGMGQGEAGQGAAPGAAASLAAREAQQTIAALRQEVERLRQELAALEAAGHDAGKGAA